MNVIWEPHPTFGYIETVCIIWFTLEFLLRLAVTPSRIQFIVGIMNIVDMVAIVPFYLEMTLAMFGIDIASLSDIKGALLVVRVLRVLRVVRILKLGRYSSGMRTFALTLRSSARQLGMMGMV
uniref:Ion_trans domain-containing protein n=1 Tax=Heterorhabditis bacteriophora TaxID=37862 RepID=A0A1I7WR10_HETBA